MTAADTGSGPEQQMCWCCGRTFPESGIIRLGSRPEAGVCLNCTISLRQRARVRAAEGRGGLAHWGAQAVNRGRQGVMARNWHRLPAVGPALRWINRHLP
ncbi:hypothetical protein QO003_003810 [Arthrobacter silviterrae]|uniref:ClpX-type ZB domain-containing protein n=1 Tax=Arthrobacter silviterrae TaxID=2026658 RepID=A0ABX0D9K9_9MICC|nr:hypothetical protein [Arthrobacter silviterrae]MDQ0279507.1 hypothetical protein [Arthrobacter silviterrae]NGN82014.1 hypothetical protein [Arthrobacter silviterrae]